MTSRARSTAEVEASFRALSIEQKVRLAWAAKNRLKRRGLRAPVSQHELLALAWYADIWLHDDTTLPKPVRPETPEAPSLAPGTEM